jgi:hypothetical protein
MVMAASKSTSARSAGGRLASLEQVYVPTRAAWRTWMALHH